MMNDCDHLFVLITRIVRGWTAPAGARVIGGNCQHCRREVKRVDDGLTITRWKVAR